MTHGDWELFENDYAAIRRTLAELLSSASARSVLLVDHTGQIITSLATPPSFDVISFASLCAADFEANRQLAQLIGEEDFKTLYHQGVRESMYLSRVESNVILAVLFDRKSTLGLVRLRTQRAVEQLHSSFLRLYEKTMQMNSAEPAEVDQEYMARAEAEIDNLFRD